MVSWEYDVLGRSESRTEGAQRRVEWGYSGTGPNELGQLIAERVFGDGGALTHETRYGYEPVPTTGPNRDSYDVRGRQRERSGPQVASGFQRIEEYTAFDLPSTVVQGLGEATHTIEMRYDASDRLSARLSAERDTRYVGRLYERTATSAGVEHRYRVYADGRPVAEIRRNTTGTGTPSESRYYLHTDALGSVVLVTDQAGNEAEERTYASFGDTDHVTATEAGYTGHRHDDELGLIDMIGRVYDPVIGRFLTPDPITAMPTWTQGLNRYAYVYNSPLAWTDPTGFFGVADRLAEQLAATRYSVGAEFTESDQENGEASGLDNDFSGGYLRVIRPANGDGASGHADSEVPTTAIAPYAPVDYISAYHMLFELYDDVGIVGRWHLGALTLADGAEPHLTAGSYVSGVSRLFAELDHPGRTPDFCLTTFGVPVAKQPLGLAIAEEVGADCQMIPVVVAGAPKMIALNATRAVDCLDESRSIFSRWTESDERPDKIGDYRGVTKLALDAERIPADAQFFRVDGWRVALIVSARVKQVMEAVGCVGARFERVA